MQAWVVVDRRSLLALDAKTTLPVEVRGNVAPRLARLIQRVFQGSGFEAPIG